MHRPSLVAVLPARLLPHPTWERPDQRLRTLVLAARLTPPSAAASQPRRLAAVVVGTWALPVQAQQSWPGLRAVAAGCWVLSSRRGPGPEPARRSCGPPSARRACRVAETGSSASGRRRWASPQEGDDSRRAQSLTAAAAARTHLWRHQLWQLARVTLVQVHAHQDLVVVVNLERRGEVEEQVPPAITWSHGSVVGRGGEGEGEGTGRPTPGQATAASYRSGVSISSWIVV